MIKFSMTQTKNIIICILGLIISLGFFIDQREAYPLFLFLIVMVACFMTRTRFVYLTYISIGISVVLYILNFGLYNGFFYAFEMPMAITYISVAVSSLLFVAYAILNYMIMIGKLPNKKEARHAND